MKKDQQVLFEKYLQLKENDLNLPEEVLEVIARGMYNELSKADYTGTDEVIMSALTQFEKLNLPIDKLQGVVEFLYNRIMDLAEQDGNYEAIQRIKDLSHIKLAGGSAHNLGLNEQEWEPHWGHSNMIDRELFKKAANDIGLDPTSRRGGPGTPDYSYKGPAPVEGAVMYGPNGEVVEVDLGDLDEIRDLKRKGFTWKQ